MNDRNTASSGNERNPDGGAFMAEVTDALAAQALDEAEEAKRRLLLEEQTRRVVDQMIEERIERLIVRERLLENQLRELVGPRDRQLQKEQSQLDALAHSLLGPQDLLEKASAVPHSDPATGRNARPIFDKPRADWTLPRIPPTGLDVKPAPDLD